MHVLRQLVVRKKEETTLKTETKRWTHLGLGAALAGSTLLAACGQGSTPAPSETATPAPELETEAPEAAKTSTPDMDDSAAMDVAPQESGEGEGGVAIEQAGTDPIVFTSALAITEAHIVAARDAFLAGETQAAAEMFAHPVSEVLFDVGPYLQERGVENFDDLLTNASIAVFDGADGDEITERTAEIIETLRAAEEKAPDNGMSDARVAAGVVADQIDRAAYMYTLIAETDEYEPYLDGYGFYKAAQAHYEKSKDLIAADYPDTASAIESALVLLGDAYPSVLRPEELPANPAALTAAGSNIQLTLSE